VSQAIIALRKYLSEEKMGREGAKGPHPYTSRTCSTRRRPSCTPASITSFALADMLFKCFSFSCCAPPPLVGMVRIKSPERGKWERKGQQGGDCFLHH
jgi:hypothetical protein